MPKDFAGRAGSSTQQRKRKPAQRVSPRQRVLFHGPSFATGALVGAAIVILTAYGPALWHQGDGTRLADQALPQPPAAVQFTFPDTLRNSRVEADPEPYAVPAEQRATLNMHYNIQAASFRDRADAEQLRARLLLENLPAKTLVSEVEGETWYRVMIGPIAGRVDTDRAMTQLREMGLSALRMSAG